MWLVAGYAGDGDIPTPPADGASTDTAAATGAESSSSVEVSTAEAVGAGQVSDQQEAELTPEEQVRQAIALLLDNGSRLDPERPGKKPRRKDIGSYADYEEEIDEEVIPLGRGAKQAPSPALENFDLLLAILLVVTFTNTSQGLWLL